MIYGKAFNEEQTSVPTCFDEIGLFSQQVDFILGSIVNKI